MSRSIVARLVALLVITVAGVYYIAYDAVGVHLVLDRPYTISVDMPATETFDGQQIPAGAGGLYSDAYVTYRGVEVGKVASLQLHPDMVVAVLHIDHGAKIPANVTANVKELTAAAEQYLDLEPAGAVGSGGYLRSGATIPESRTSVPVSIGTLLDALDNLVDNLSVSDLNTLTSALATGLQDAGPDLRQIIDDSDALVEALQSATSGTTELINGGSTVLSTFNQTSNDFSEFVTDLDQLSAQLAANNQDFKNLLSTGASAGQTLDPFLTQTAGSTVGLIDNLATATNTAYQRQDAFRALFEVLPLFSTDVAETVQGGQIHFQVDFNSRSPVCTYTPMLPEPTEAVTGTADLDGNCPVTAPDMLQRGADTAPPPHS